MDETRHHLSLVQRARLKVTKKIIQTFGRKPLSIAPSRGLVSFTFDDFPSSAYRTGGAILQQHGVRGTYYAAFGLMGGESEGLTMMTGEDVAALLEDGHELGCHTYSHVSCSGLRGQDLEREFADNLAAMTKTSGLRQWSSFSYPFGDITLGAKSLASSRFSTCRGRRAGLNHGTIDLAALNSDSIYSHTDSMERTQEQITATATRRGWTIFCTHDVSSAPSPFGCTPEHLESAVKAALAAGCEVMTVTEAYRRLGESASSTAINNNKEE